MNENVPASVLSTAREAGEDVGHLFRQGVMSRRVDLQPGDSTRYIVHVVWTHDLSDDLMVAVSNMHGAAEFPSDLRERGSWDGDYLESAMGLGSGNGWTGTVLSAFLAGVSEGLHGL